MLESELFKFIYLKGFKYTGEFRHVESIRGDGLTGKIKWNSNWVTFLDGILVSSSKLEKISSAVPTKIRKILIDPKKHINLLENEVLDFSIAPFMKIIKCGGVEMHEIQTAPLNKRRTRPAALETYHFVPYFPDETFTVKNALKILFQIICENLQTKSLSVVEVKSDSSKTSLGPKVIEALENQLGVTVDILTVSSLEENIEKSADVIIDEGRQSRQNPEGYIISRDLVEKSVVNSNFITVSRLKTDNEFLSLLKMKKDRLFDLPIVRISRKVEDWLGPLKININIGAVALSEHQDVSGIVGLAKCIRREPFGFQLKCFAIQDKNAQPFNVENSQYSDQLTHDLMMNVLKDGKFGGYRHLDLSQNYEDCEDINKHFYLDCKVKSDLSTITWLSGPLNPKTEKELINISYTSLNFKDVMVASGRITSTALKKNHFTSMGSEFSGITGDGKRIMGLNRIGGVMATHCRQLDATTWSIPDDWTLEQAATVPVVYFTVYFAFFNETKIKRGQSILIHSGSGGIGQAAIQVALAYGLNVFTTVGSKEKKEFLLNKFPQLKSENIGNSRSSEFEMSVMNETQGEGVDFVLNSLSGEMLQASIRCLKLFGTFLEVSQLDIQNKTNIHMGHLLKRINFKTVMYSDINTKLEDLKVKAKLYLKIDQLMIFNFSCSTSKD